MAELQAELEAANRTVATQTEALAAQAEALAAEDWESAALRAALQQQRQQQPAEKPLRTAEEEAKVSRGEGGDADVAQGPPRRDGPPAPSADLSSSTSPSVRARIEEANVVSYNSEAERWLAKLDPVSWIKEEAAVVAAWAKAGKAEEAERCLAKLEEKGLEAGVWAALSGGFSFRLGWTKTRKTHTPTHTHTHTHTHTRPRRISLRDSTMRAPCTPDTWHPVPRVRSTQQYITSYCSIRAAGGVREN